MNDRAHCVLVSVCLWLFFLQTLEQVSSQTKASYIEAEAEYNICKNRFRDKLPSECTVQPVQCSQGSAARAVQSGQCVSFLSQLMSPVYAAPLCACVYMCGVYVYMCGACVYMCGVCVYMCGVYVHISFCWSCLGAVSSSAALHLLQWETMLTFTMGPFCLPHYLHSS